MDPDPEPDINMEDSEEYETYYPDGNNVPPEYLNRCIDYVKRNFPDRPELLKRSVAVAHAHHHYMMCTCDGMAQYHSSDLFDSVLNDWRPSVDEDNTNYIDNTIVHCNARLHAECCHKRYNMVIPTYITKYGPDFSLDSDRCHCDLLRVN